MVSPEQTLTWLAELFARQQSGGYASDHLAHFFKSQRQLEASDRESLAAQFYELVKRARRLAFALDIEAPDPKTAVRLSMLADGTLQASMLSGFHPEVDWQQALERFRALPGVTDPSLRWAILRNLSDDVASALSSALRDEAEAFFESIARPGLRTIRANLLRGDRDDLATKLQAEGFELTPTRFATQGLVVDAGPDLFRTAAFREGAFEMQDEGSQLIAEIVAPPPGGLVVDVCAGAGGKSLALASRLGGRGKVLALDIHEHKLEVLRQRARRAGASNIEAVRIEAEGPLPPRVFEQLARADRVLVDAPCSGLGVLRRNPEAGARLTRADLDRFPVLQASIAQRVLPSLAPGARLVYSTCTVLPAENEAVVSSLLEVDPDLEWVRISEILGGERAKPISDSEGRSLRLRPDLHGTDGFFLAVLRKRRTRVLHGQRE